MKTVGATSHFFTRHYLIVLAILGFLGTILGLFTGFLLQNVLDLLFSGFLPRNVKLVISWQAILEGLCLGVFVVGLFSFIPLHRLKEIKPVTIFRKERIRSQRGASFYFSVFLIFVFFLLLVFWQGKEIKTGLYFISGVIVVILITGLLAGVALLFLKRL